MARTTAAPIGAQEQHTRPAERIPTASYYSLGPVRAAWYETAVTEAEAYEVIGRNAVAGFGIVVHTRTAQGEALMMPDGQRMTVTVVTGPVSGAVHGVFVLTGGAL